MPSMRVDHLSSSNVVFNQPRSHIDIALHINQLGCCLNAGGERQ
jgi:hypothetical protein